MESRIEVWRAYADLYRTEVRWLALSLTVSVVQSLVFLPIAALVGSVFDAVIPSRDLATLVRVCCAIVGLYLASGALALVTRKLAQNSTKRAVSRLRETLVSRLLSLPRGYFDEADSAHLHTRVVQDTALVDAMGNSLVADLVPALLTGTLLGVVLAGLSPRLFLVLLGVLPFLYILRLALRTRVNTWVERLHISSESFNRSVLLLLHMLDLTRTRAAETEERARLGRTIDDLREVGGKTVWLLYAYGYVQSTVATTSAAVVLVFGGTAVARGSMTLGQLAAFYVIMALMQTQLRNIFSNLPSLIEGAQALERIHRFLTIPVTQPYAGAGQIQFHGKVSLDDVHFSFPRDEVLRGVSLEIRPGEIVALTGGNGAGKSTLLNLILGFYRPANGLLRADGIRYEDIDLHHLRRQVGLVEQRPIVFPGTIAENIAFGRTEATVDEIHECARLAGLDTLVSALPAGYATRIGEDGHLLSGGEKQRVAIARAFLGNPRLVLLDEPTNNLDGPARHHLLGSLLTLRQRGAIVMVTHEADALSAADRVYVLAHGRVVASGSPADLRESGLLPAEAVRTESQRTGNVPW